MLESIKGGYFFATTPGSTPATIGTGLASCNPLIAIALDVFVERSFDDAPAKAKWLLAGCTVAYCGAITILIAFTH